MGPAVPLGHGQTRTDIDRDKVKLYNKKDKLFSVLDNTSQYVIEWQMPTHNWSIVETDPEPRCTNSVDFYLGKFAFSLTRLWASSRKADFIGNWLDMASALEQVLILV